MLCTGGNEYYRYGTTLYKEDRGIMAHPPCDLAGKVNVNERRVTEGDIPPDSGRRMSGARRGRGDFEGETDSAVRARETIYVWRSLSSARNVDHETQVPTETSV